MKMIRRFEEHEEIDSEGTWAISYGDMVTLLLCFFILFFTVDHEKDQQKKMQSAIFQLFQTQTSAPDQTGADNKVSIGSAKEVGIDQKILQSLDGKSHQVGNKILIEFPEVSFFASASTELSQPGRLALKKFVDKYMPYAGTHVLSIRAFTDERKVIPYKDRRFSDNLELSALRAISTMRSLQKQGIPLSRMRVGGYGELQTDADALNIKDLSQRRDLSRKVVLVIEPGGERDL